MLMGHVIHISFDLSWGASVIEWFCGKVSHLKHNSVVTLPIAINGSADCSILLGIFFVLAR